MSSGQTPYMRKKDIFKFIEVAKTGKFGDAIKDEANQTRYTSKTHYKTMYRWIDVNIMRKYSLVTGEWAKNNIPVEYRDRFVNSYERAVTNPLYDTEEDKSKIEDASLLQTALQSEIERQDAESKQDASSPDKSKLAASPPVTPAKAGPPIPPRPPSDALSTLAEVASRQAEDERIAARQRQALLKAQQKIANAPPIPPAPLKKDGTPFNEPIMQREYDPRTQTQEAAAKVDPESKEAIPEQPTTSRRGRDVTDPEIAQAAAAASPPGSPPVTPRAAAAAAAPAQAPANNVNVPAGDNDAPDANLPIAGGDIPNDADSQRQNIRMKIADLTPNNIVELLGKNPEEGPNISEYGFQRQVSNICVRNGKNFGFYKKKVMKMEVVKTKYNERKKETSICLLEYGALFGIAKLQTDFAYGECVELYALKECYKDVLAKEDAWKTAIVSMVPKKDEADEGGEAPKQMGFVIPFNDELIRRYGLRRGGNGPHNPQNGGPNQMEKEMIKNERNYSKGKQLKQPDLKPKEFRIRDITRLNDRIPMNRRVGYRMPDLRPTGQRPRFRYK